MIQKIFWTITEKSLSFKYAWNKKALAKTHEQSILLRDNKLCTKNFHSKTDDSVRKRKGQRVSNWAILLQSITTIRSRELRKPCNFQNYQQTNQNKSSKWNECLWNFFQKCKGASLNILIWPWNRSWSLKLTRTGEAHQTLTPYKTENISRQCLTNYRTKGFGQMERLYLAPRTCATVTQGAVHMTLLFMWHSYKVCCS